jgi:hypothetical protein
VRPHDLAEANGMARAAAVLLHPHPEMGGDRFNNVVSELYRALPPAGVTAIRFDFSGSKIDGAAEETIEALDQLPDDIPRFLVGYRRHDHRRAGCGLVPRGSGDHVDRAGDR